MFGLPREDVMPCVYHWVDGCAHEVTKLYEDETGIWIVITCYPDDECLNEANKIIRFMNRRFPEIAVMRVKFVEVP